MDEMPLEKKELKELLVKCWMTHDAMWFTHCLQECGIDKTSKINREAVKAVAAVEIGGLKKTSDRVARREIGLAETRLAGLVEELRDPDVPDEERGRRRLARHGVGRHQRRIV